MIGLLGGTVILPDDQAAVAARRDGGRRFIDRSVIGMFAQIEGVGGKGRRADGTAAADQPQD